MNRQIPPLRDHCTRNADCSTRAVFRVLLSDRPWRPDRADTPRERTGPRAVLERNRENEKNGDTQNTTRRFAALKAACTVANEQV